MQEKEITIESTFKRINERRKELGINPSSFSTYTRKIPKKIFKREVKYLIGSTGRVIPYKV